MRISLGKGYLDRWTIIELKKFFSIYVHRFNTIEQDRFHSHAFNGLAILFKGGYIEEVKDKRGNIIFKWVGPGIRFIPKEYNHRLLRSKPNSWSILFAGPWSAHWYEECEKWKRKLGWGREILSQQNL